MTDGFLARLLGRRTAPPAPPKPPEIDAVRCVHGQVADASCRRCGLACPHGAIEFAVRDLELDTAKCDGCGLCAAVCPTKAIGVTPAVVVQGDTSGYAACQRLIAEGGGAVSPCLHAIGVEELLRAWQSGVRELRVARGDCAECSRGPRDLFDQALSGVNALLASRSLPGLVLVELDARTWRLATAAMRHDLEVNPARRRFLKRIAQPEAASAVEPGPATAALPDNDAALFAFVPEIDESACVACDACVRICPTTALTLLDDLATPAYRVSPASCTGCAMCRDVCEPKAIRVESWRAAPRREVALATRYCPVCRANYRVMAGEERSELCRVCRKTQRHRLLHQVITDS
jgi:ferredoxin